MDEEDDLISLNMSFDEESNFFVLTYFRKAGALFQVKMHPNQFERMVTDMMRVIKNYNLNEAQKYLDQKNAQQETEAEQLHLTWVVHDWKGSSELIAAQSK